MRSSDYCLGLRPTSVRMFCSRACHATNPQHLDKPYSSHRKKHGWTRRGRVRFMGPRIYICSRHVLQSGSPRRIGRGEMRRERGDVGVGEVPSEKKWSVIDIRLGHLRTGCSRLRARGWWRLLACSLGLTLPRETLTGSAQHHFCLRWPTGSIPQTHSISKAISASPPPCKDSANASKA